MSAAALLLELENVGVRVAIEGDRLRLIGDQAAIDARLDSIRAHKSELIARLTTAANDAPDRHHTWLVTLPTGERFSAMYAPPKTLAEIQAIYPGAQVEREPDPAPAPPLSPSALEVVYCWLRHVGEEDLQAGQQFIEACARDPAQLRACFEDVVRLGLADWPTAETEPDTEIEDATAPKAVCARCGHWRADSVNAQGGLGTCLTRAPASRRVGSCWPWLDAEIRCKEFREVSR